MVKAIIQIPREPISMIVQVTRLVGFAWVLTLAVLLLVEIPGVSEELVLFGLASACVALF